MSRAEPARAQVVVELEVEGDGLALIVDDRPALARALGEDHVVRADVDRRAIHGDGRRAGADKRGGKFRGVGVGDGLVATFGVSLPNCLPRFRKLPLAE